MTAPSDPSFTDSARPRLSLAQYAAILDHLHEGIYLLESGVFTYVNRALASLAGGSPEQVVGKPLTYMIAPEDHEVVAARYRRRSEGQELSETYEFSVLALDRVTRIPVFMRTARIPAQHGFVSAGTIVPLAQRAALSASLADHAALSGEESERLSIPVLQIHPEVLVVPLVGRVNATRARILMDRVLAALSELRASRVLLDITGVPVVDERVAGYLVRTAAAVRLLGAHLTLAGISPTVAQTLVALGVDLKNLETTGSLQDAWQSASRHLK